MSDPAPKPTKTYDFHRYANLFPLLDDKSPTYVALVEDIKAKGQQEPIWLYEGKVLDGRNRYRACQKLGREVKTRDYIGDDPIALVLTLNLHRRHLNTKERAKVGAEITNLEKGANQYTKENGVTVETASKLLNVSTASIGRAKAVVAKGVDPSKPAPEPTPTASPVTPPKPETKEEKEAREAKEAEAKKAKDTTKASDKVDEVTDDLIEALKAYKELSDSGTIQAAVAKIVQRFQDAGWLERGKKK
jgi:ParB-like chromosome segregation protein Spo0J